MLELPLSALLSGYARRRLIRRGVPIRTDTYLVGDHLIWGATARILADLFDRIGPLLKERESRSRLIGWSAAPDGDALAMVCRA